MADSRVLGDYGAPYVDAKAMRNPQTQLAAAKFNRLAEDNAHFSRSSLRVTVDFLTSTSGSLPFTIATADIHVDGHWGSGDSQKPTIQKTATGLYTITFATSYTDALLTVQTVSFLRGTAAVMTNTNDVDEAKVKTIAANVVTLAVFRAAALSDLGGTGVVSVFLR